MIKEIFELQNIWRKETEFFSKFMTREILDTLIQNISNNKIIGLIGSRQVGKSSLLYLLINSLITNNVRPANIYYFNLDDLKLHELFENIPIFIDFIGRDKIKKYIFIDEIQRLKNPGLFLKELYDLNLNLKIFYSGSSQLEVKSKLKEHLVGRARQFIIHRLSINEFIQFCAPTTKIESLKNILIYGSYPGVVLESSITEKKLSINDIFQSYVQKDVIDFLRVSNIDAFNKLLVLLANQIGGLLSTDNMSNHLNISRNEVERYISILESTFIIQRVYPFHKNYRKEITKTPKIFFLDLGLRNYIINNFNDLNQRDDVGKLFENFYFTKLLSDDYFHENRINYWRTTNQTEIDFIITRGNDMEAIEVKWENTKRPKSFNTIEKYYPGIKTSVVSKDF